MSFLNITFMFEWIYVWIYFIIIFKSFARACYGKSYFVEVLLGNSGSTDRETGVYELVF